MALTDADKKAIGEMIGLAIPQAAQAAAEAARQGAAVPSAESVTVSFVFTPSLAFEMKIDPPEKAREEMFSIIAGQAEGVMARLRDHRLAEAIKFQ